MAIDELPQIGWTQRLKTNRVDECIALREIGEVTFFPGQKGSEKEQSSRTSRLPLQLKSSSASQGYHFLKGR